MLRVPSNWIRVNSSKQTNRYHPPEVLTALDRLTLVKEELAVACRTVRTTWSNILSGFGKCYAQFQAPVQAVAAVNCFHSLAILSRNQNYVRPSFVNDDEPCQVCIQSGRHPVLDTVLGDNFVLNDTTLHADSEYCQIVTGPNMGGKSCYIRQVALIAIMAQLPSSCITRSAVMAAKMEADVSTRVANQVQKLILDAQLKLVRNSSSQTSSSLTENEQVEELAT